MKIIYSNTELQHNTKSYNSLINKPSLNGKVLQDNVSLDTLSLYDKPEVERLVNAVSQIRLVSAMPADPEPNMTYYIGPDERNLYDVILVNDAKQQIRMGTTQFGQYKSGAGINVAFDNTININTDNMSTYIDSEGNLASSLDGEALPAFTGATASTAGTKGLVPKPLTGEQNYALFGDGTWKNVYDYIYPVGAVVVFNDSSKDPNTLYGGTWSKLDAGYILYNDATGNGSKVTSTGLPNITGTITGPRGSVGWGNLTPNGCFYQEANSTTNCVDYNEEGGNYSIGFQASRSSSVYKNIDIVQPPAYKVCVWRRTA